jgi:glycosyltransferase involved in cell wall biosynthesis
MHVTRAWALDARRHLAFRKRYPGFLARPDRWATWIPSGIWAGHRLVRRFAPDLIWGTYPIPSALEIARRVAARSGLPWVADFRDAMVDDEYPESVSQRKIFSRIESACVHSAAATVLTTPSALAMYRARYPDIDAGRWHCIRNGFAEEEFVAAERARDSTEGREGRLRLLHSGLLNKADRNPTPFLEAMRQLRDAGKLESGSIEVLLRAPGDVAWMRSEVTARRLEDIVRVEPAIPYVEALQEMLSADGLLLFQGPSCNHLVPAKLYEYMRCGRPILALTTYEGETGELVVRENCGIVADMLSVSVIASLLPGFLDGIRSGKVPRASREVAEKYSRSAQARELAALFEKVAG